MPRRKSGGKRPSEKKWKVIIIPAKLYERLKKYNEHPYKAIEYLLDAYEDYRNFYIKKIMCNDLRTAKASLAAWYKLLRSRGLNDEDVAKALEYLKPHPGETEMFIVNGDKCEE